MVDIFIFEEFTLNNLNKIFLLLDFVIAARQMGLGHVGEMVMKQVFRSFDKNHNGRLEMHEALGAINILKSKHGGGGHGSGFGF